MDEITINEITINERVIFFVLNDNDIIKEYEFTKYNEHNKIMYELCGYSNSPQYMDLNIFKKNNFDPSNLNFCFKIGNKLKPYCFIEWLFSNKNKYEINKGKIYKLSKIKNISDTFNFKIGEEYTKEELLNIINSFENIEVGDFSNNYTQEYYNKNVNFVKIDF
jgi:hypothetical protein